MMGEDEDGFFCDYCAEDIYDEDDCIRSKDLLFCSETCFEEYFDDCRCHVRGGFEMPIDVGVEAES